MGKSRLSLKSGAFRRQVEFYKSDQSRLGKDAVRYVDPLDQEEEDDVSVVDTQYENIKSCLEQLARATTLKIRCDTLIRGRKGVAKYSYVNKRNMIPEDMTTDTVRCQEKGSDIHQTKGSSSYATRVRGHKEAAKSTCTCKKDNNISASEVKVRPSPQGTEGLAFFMLKELVNSLDTKSDSERVKTLLVLTDLLEGTVIRNFLRRLCITIFYGCLKSFTVGSAHESYLATRVIGLLAIQVGRVNNCCEMMRKSIPIFTMAWNLNNEPLILSILDCLAVTTFFGASGVEEVEKSMSIMWAIFSPKPLSDSEKPTGAVLAKAISAWSFLLTRIDPWRISLKIWKESCSFFSSLLEYDDCRVTIAVAEAFAVIFDTERSDKFTWKGDIDILEINGKINEIVSNTKDPYMRDTLTTISKFFEIEYYEESIDIPNKREPLELSSFSQSIQLKYFKSFLGPDGFNRHIQDNKVLHDIFDYEEDYKEGKIETTLSDNEEEVHSRLPTLEAPKERTQLRNKNRMRAVDMDYGFGPFDIDSQKY